MKRVGAVACIGTGGVVFGNWPDRAEHGNAPFRDTEARERRSSKL